MTEPVSETVRVGTGAAARDIAMVSRAGLAPGLFWLGGFRSDMAGSKALALDGLGAETGHAVTRFDYSGHGRSGGAFESGSISRWLEEAVAVFATTTGPQVVVGSSMGGWLALLLNRVLRRAGEPRIAALVLVAPAVDMTEDLMFAGFSGDDRLALLSRGYVELPSDYSSEPYRLTRTLIEDGRKHLLFGASIETGCPVTILQGGRDTDVPRAHAEKLVAHLTVDPVTLTLVPDGDHRLSRERDLLLLRRVVRAALLP